MLVYVLERSLLGVVYEGGFKLWECAVDLCEYMLDELHCNEEPAAMKGPSERLSVRVMRGSGCRVIELGCGHGLPGIIALRAGNLPTR